MDTGLLIGKKKVIYIVSGILGNLAAQYLTPEAASQVTKLLAELTPIVLALTGVGVETTLDIKRNDTAKETQKTEQLKWQGSSDPENLEPEVIVEPFDMGGFMARVERLAEWKWPGTEHKRALWYAYREVGMTVKCRHITHALAYWDKAVQLVHEAFFEVAGFQPGEAIHQLDRGKNMCPHPSVESMARDEGYFNLLVDTRYTTMKQREVEAVFESEIDWKYKLGGHASLYMVGERADDLLGLPPTYSGLKVETKL